MMDHKKLVSSIDDQRAHRPLSVLTLAEPLLSDQPRTQSPNSQTNQESSTTSANISADVVTNPATLKADLQHYRDLFSKLRFSYLEQVTKEKYLRSIVGDPPVLYSHDENLALEDTLLSMKSELKAKKEANERLVGEIEELAGELAEKYEIVQDGADKLRVLPEEIAVLEREVDQIRIELRRKEAEMEVDASLEDPRLNMSLAETESAIEQQKQKMREVDEQIAMLQRSLPPKMRECERTERELEELEGRRNEVTRLAREVRRIKEEGGRDALEDRGRWYRAEEQVLRGLLGVKS